MVKIDQKLTANVAELSRLELTAEENRLFTEQLSKVLDYVEQLQKVELAGVIPMTHPLDLATPLREDVVEASKVDSDGKSRMLDPAPEVVDGGFKVPPIL
jgi:aspartyl-tRNA(Asn)/glutamyl-tRNA(Gln) amidotransferase subunit C